MKKQLATSPRSKKARFGSRRTEVVDLLQRGVKTVAELAAHLRLTNNAVRSHLLALERDGLVHRSGSQPGTRRPHELYDLTPRAQKYLAQASTATLNAVLTAMKDILPKALSGLLAAGGEVLASRFGRDDAEKPLSVRVQSAARVLNSIGGAAQVEKHGDDSFCILSQGCPLDRVTVEHPETCYMIEKFLSGLIHAPVRESCLRGLHPQCRFTVGTYGGRMLAPEVRHKGSRPSPP